MSILTEPLPDYIIVNGKNYRIQSDFRVWLRIDAAMRDNTLPYNDRILKVISECFEPKTCPVLPENLSSTLERIVEFYNCNKKGTQNKKGTENLGVFSYEEDAEYIYAAFYQCYGIDLTNENMHWWQFKALLEALPQEVQLMKIIGYRSVNTAEIGDKGRRRFYNEMKRIYALCDNRTEEEKEGALAEALSKLI